MPFYPIGRVYPGYRWRLFRRETMEGVSVLRVFSIPSRNRGVLLRLLSYSSFAFAAVLGGLFVRRPDIVLASVPNPGTDLAGVILARLRFARSVVELRDIVTESLPMIGHSRKGTLARLASVYMRIVYRTADAIAVPYKPMTDLLRRTGVSEERIFLLPHAADPEPDVDPAKIKSIRETLRLGDSFVALYAGNLAAYYGLETLIEAARILKQSAASVKIVLLGAGTERERIEEIVRSEQLDTLTLAGPVAPHEVVPYLLAANLLITSLSRTPYEPGDGFLYTKECQYLLTGRPIVAVEDRARMKILLDRIDAGIGISHADAAELAKTLQWYASHPKEAEQQGCKGQEYAKRELLRDNIVGLFEQDLVAWLKGHDVVLRK